MKPMKKLFFAMALLVLVLLLLGCTSKKTTPEENGLSETNNSAQGSSIEDDRITGEGGNIETTSKTDDVTTNVVCNAQKIMEEKSFVIGADKLDFCKKQNFESLIQGIYLLVGKDTYEKNKQKTGKEFYEDMKNDSDLRNYSNPAGIKVYLKINPEKQIDGFLPGNLPNPTNKGLVRCNLEQERGENLNCQYCENFFLWKQNISESGEVGGDLVYVLNPTFDFTSAEFQDVTTSLDQNLKDFVGDAQVYKITEFNAEFGCIKKFDKYTGE